MNYISLIFQAIQEDNVKVIEVLVEQPDFNINSTNNFGITPIIFAAFHSKNKIIEILISKGADPNALWKNIIPSTLSLFKEAKDGNEQASASLKGLGFQTEVIKQAGKIDETIEEIETILIKQNRAKELAIAKGIQPIEFGETALGFAVNNNNIKLAKILLKAGAKVDSLYSTGETPLFRAIILNKVEIAKLLLDHGANINFIWHQFKRGFFRETALTLALKCHQDIEMIKLLLKYGAKSNLLAQHLVINETAELVPSTSAELQHYIHRINNMTAIEEEAFINKNSNIFTLNILEHLIMSDRPNLMEVFLDAGLDPNSKSDFGETLLCRAVRLGKESIVRLLIKRGANINTKSPLDNTPLIFIANSCGNKNIFNLIKNSNHVIKQ